MLSLAAGALIGCTESPQDALTSPDGPRLADAASCGVSMTVVTADEDTVLAQYDVPLVIDTARVCETWTGTDYEVRVENVGGSETWAGRTPDDVQGFDYRSGSVTALASPTQVLDSPDEIGPSLFDFAKVDDVTRQASFDDPYYAIRAYDAAPPPDAPCDPAVMLCGVAPVATRVTQAGAPRTSAAAPLALDLTRSAQMASKDTTKFRKHKLKRGGLRAILEEADEIGAPKDKFRVFKKYKADKNETTTYTVHAATELLVEEETDSPEMRTVQKHRWRKVPGGYVIGRMYIEDEERENGKSKKSRSTMEFLDVKVR